jgi:hypothetical protein
MSNVPGLFAAGDIVKKPLRQVVTAAGDGALSSNSIIAYLRKGAGIDEPKRSVSSSVAGVSGAGKTTFASVCEEYGYYVIEDLPVSMVPSLFKLFKEKIRTLCQRRHLRQHRGRERGDRSRQERSGFRSGVGRPRLRL